MDSHEDQNQQNQRSYLQQDSDLAYSMSPRQRGLLVNDNFEVQIDQREYGGLRNLPIRSVQFNPRELGILDRYIDTKLIYNEMLTSTKVILSKDLATDQNVIKKVISKDKLMNPIAQKFAMQECAIHSQLDHDNIVKLLNYTETKDEYVLYLEFCDKADYLAQKILETHTPITNNDKLLSYSQDILEGLKYTHNSGVIHQDIKLENLLTESAQREDEFNKIKICDFGFAQICDPNSGKVKVEVKCGTMGYMAPEIRQDHFIGPEIDMWSFGVVLYELAAAYKPTQVQNYRYGSGPIPFRRQDWKKRSQNLKDLISQCLEVNPEKRISAEDALQHPFFSEEEICE